MALNNSTRACVVLGEMSGWGWEVNNGGKISYKFLWKLTGGGEQERKISNARLRSPEVSKAEMLATYEA